MASSTGTKNVVLSPPPPMPEEPLLRDLGNDRFSLRPLKYPDIFAWYKRMQSCYWQAEECDLSRDPIDFAKLSPSEQHFVLSVLSFFSAADLLISENLLSNFMEEIEIPEVRMVYGFQNTVENIHSETYALMLETLATPLQQEKAFKAIEQVPSIQRKHQWAVQYTDRDKVPFTERLVAFAVFEGILFASSFAAIYFFKSKGVMPGLCFSNELIARDESLHADFATFLYTDHIVNRLSDAKVHAIVSAAVEAEEQFVKEALHSDLIGLGKDRLIKYVHHVANRLLLALGHPALYDDAETLSYMEQISIDTSANFFEKRNSSYARRPMTAGQISSFEEEFLRSRSFDFHPSPPDDDDAGK